MLPMLRTFWATLEATRNEEQARNHVTLAKSLHL